jgi:uncharacterized protein (DUF302 family)
MKQIPNAPVQRQPTGDEQMSYVFSKTVAVSFDQAIARVTEELGKEGFGVLTEIDVQETLKKKLDVDFRKYRILGTCNPSFAHRALQAEALIGAMLPCNVIVQEYEDGRIEVAAVDPGASMQAIDNAELADIAGQVQVKLRQVIERL